MKARLYSITFSLTLSLTASAAAKAPAVHTIAEQWQKAKAHFENRDFVKAAAELETLVKDHPDHWEARPIGAWFYWEASKRNSQERVSLEKKAESMILGAPESQKNTWIYQREIGDFYYLREGSLAKAYPFYLKAKENFAEATPVQKASLLDRIARSAEALGRKGDAVKAACQALEQDPTDKMATNRIKNLAGNCQAKGVNLDPKQDPSPVPAAAPKNPSSDEGSSH